MRYRRTRVISGRGLRPEQFRESLRGVAVDRQGLVFGVGDDEVKVFDSAGGLLRRWKTASPGYCISVDRGICVGESGRIEEFDSDGNVLRTLEDSRLGVVTALGRSGDDMLVGDATDRSIRRYSRDGEWLNDIGKDNKTKGFIIPNGHVDFSVDARGVIHATNPGKHRVERYKPTGELLGFFGRFGMQRPEDFTGCCNPTNLAVFPDGEVVVTEKAPPRLKVLDARGGLVCMVEAEAFDPQCKNMDVAVDGEGRILVVDTVRLHILVFEREPAPATAPASVQAS